MQNVQSDKLATVAINNGITLRELNEKLQNLPQHEIQQQRFEGMVNRHGFPDLLPGIYYGHCENGKRNGYGLLYCENTDHDFSFYECMWVKGRAVRGRRIAIMNGKWAIFEGNLDEKQLITGYAKWNNEDGHSYEGECHQGRWQGMGIYTFENGYFEVGQYINCKSVYRHNYYSSSGRQLLSRIYTEDKNLSRSQIQISY
ncbi:hypothetical protein FGO68_gene12336 [Halteria grandinella]|uniref:MORN repeat-containing protein n=1 Tax=Halteria grandinella TaxID=5974 RepID=A0A8J8NT92_HALGN|nr:hypothetical protein FGO68_gene12336 [Halteria grandinella]